MPSFKINLQAPSKFILKNGTITSDRKLKILRKKLSTPSWWEYWIPKLRLKVASNKNSVKIISRNWLGKYLQAKKGIERLKLPKEFPENCWIPVQLSPKFHNLRMTNWSKSIPSLKNKLECVSQLNRSKLENKSWKSNISTPKPGTQNISKPIQSPKKPLIQFKGRIPFENGKKRKRWKNSWKRLLFSTLSWDSKNNSNPTSKPSMVKARNPKKNTSNGSTIRSRVKFNRKWAKCNKSMFKQWKKTRRDKNLNIHMLSGCRNSIRIHRLRRKKIGLRRCLRAKSKPNNKWKKWRKDMSQQLLSKIGLVRKAKAHRTYS